MLTKTNYPAIQTQLRLSHDWNGFDGIPSIDVDQLEQLFPGLSLKDQAVRLTIPAARSTGHMDINEIGLVTALVRHLGAKTYAEIGTFDGLTTLNILDNCVAVERIYTVDLPPDIATHGGDGSRYPIDQANAAMIDTVEIGSRFQDHPRRSIVTQLRQDSATLQRRQFDSPCDVVFVDGAHTYRYCCSDSELAMGLATKPGGVVIWHDYAKVTWLPGVTQALLEISKAHRDWRLFWLNGPKLKSSLVVGVRTNA